MGWSENLKNPGWKNIDSLLKKVMFYTYVTCFATTVGSIKLLAPLQEEYATFGEE